MRVDRLFLKNFRNLKDFEVNFDVTSPRQVVVGRNGVGKSNLLEALAQIFRELDLEEESQFEYEVEYHCNGYYVKITSEQGLARKKGADATFKRTFAIAPDKGKAEETHA